MSGPIRIVVADDHKLFLAGLRLLLTSLPECIVVGEATTGREDVELVRELLPDVVLMDVQMPELHGIGATRQILRESPHVGVIMVTTFEDDESVFLAMRAGARGYVLKGADREELQRAILAVASGEALFTAGIATRLMRFFAQPRREFPVDAFPDLT
jgi:DNA-binding NarL/FixJ family response regulator